MHSQRVAPSRADSSEPNFAAADRSGPAHTASELARDWPPAAKRKGALARSVGFSRRQLEGRSGPASSVALALLMAPERPVSTPPHGAAGDGTAKLAATSERATDGLRARTAADRRAVGVFPDTTCVQTPLPNPASGAEWRTRAVPDSKPAAQSAPESKPMSLSSSGPAPRSERAASEAPRWTRPLVDQAVASATFARRANSATDDTHARAAEALHRSLELHDSLLRFDMGIARDGAHNPTGAPRLGALATLPRSLHAKLTSGPARERVARHLRRTLNSARVAVARLQSEHSNSWSSRWPRSWSILSAGGASLGTSDVRGALGDACADASAERAGSTAFGASSELATSEWASAAVFTSLLALLFML